MTQKSNKTKLQESVSHPLLTIAWDPSLVTEEQYVKLVVALGDLIRAEGGAGVKRLRAKGFGINVGASVNA